MPTKERIHQLVDLWPDGDGHLEAAERVLEPKDIGESNGTIDSNGKVQLDDDPWRDVVPMQGDVSDLVSLTVDLTDEQREQQRTHWRKARDELIAEGAEPGKYIGQLEAEADLEDAQAVASHG
jgi:hypothetical protein